MTTQAHIKERPILVSGPLIRPIQEKIKTQTRRLNRLKKINENPDHWKFKSVDFDGLYVFEEQARCKNTLHIQCPYGKVGDRLWVREAWGMEGHGTCSVEGPHISVCYRATDGKAVDPISIYVERNEYAKYRARWNSSPATTMPWTPSIHMPRWASRINLEITDIRVELLQDISEEDAMAEGIQSERLVPDLSDDCMPHNRIGYVSGIHPFPKGMIYVNAKEAFQELWNQINSNWAANPWVWAVTFKVAE